MGFADLLAPIAAPETRLGRLRIMSPTCGLRVNAFALGGMSLGEAWSDYVPPVNKEKAFELLDAWYEAGGVSIDTSNHYQDEESETFIGAWMASRRNRNNLVVGTKFTSRGYKHGKNITANTAGNSRKSLHVSLHESLRKLQTDYVDILYVHFWDYTTSIEELMDSLDHYVKLGKILYLGASNLPAWIVAGCNSYAKATGRTPFSTYQGKWSVLEREIEREIVPMCRAYNMAIQPWAALGQGRLQSPEQLAKLSADNGGGIRSLGRGPDQTEIEYRMSLVLTEIAAKHQVDGVQPILMAWLYAKYTYCYPVIGMYDKEHIRLNTAALDVKLDEEDVAKIDAINPTNFGYPNNFNGQDPHETGSLTAVPSGQVGTIDWVVNRRVYSHQI